MSVHLELTPKLLAGLRFDKQVDARGKEAGPTPPGVREWVVRDTGVRGLLLRLTPRTSTWYVQRKVAGAPMRRAMGHWWSADEGYRRLLLDDARKRAKIWLGLMEQGIDPLVEKKKRQREASAERLRDATTMSVAFDEYVKRKSGKAAASTTYDRQKVAKWMRGSALWSMSVRDITYDHVDAALRPLLSAVLNGTKLPTWGPRSISPGVYNRILSYTAAAYQRAAAAAGLAHGRGVGPFAEWSSDNVHPKSKPRTTYLKTDTESGQEWLRRLYEFRQRAHDPKVLEQRANPRGGELKPHVSVLLDYYFCLLLWGFRRNETALLRWESVDFEQRTITFPDSTTKTGKTGVLPLTPWAREILMARKRANEQWRPDDPSGWVFPSRERGKHLANARSVIVEIKKETGVWITPHDLRRTLATKVGKKVRLEDMGRLALVGAALNHAVGSHVTADYIQERAETLRHHHEEWEDYLRGLLGLHSLRSHNKPKKTSAAALLKELDADPVAARALYEVLKKRLQKRS